MTHMFNLAIFFFALASSYFYIQYFSEYGLHFFGQQHAYLMTNHVSKAVPYKGGKEQYLKVVTCSTIAVRMKNDTI